MESRQEQLSQLRAFIKEAEKEVTLILQSLHWDRDSLIQAGKADSMVTCKYDDNHRIPIKKQKEHEEKCFLKCHGYKSDDLFLPEAPDPDAKTLVKFTSDQIKYIIDTASKTDPLFKRGNASLESEPKTLGRLAATYTTDERRVIHDAVVNTMPLFHNLSDLALPSSSSGGSDSKCKSRQEVLAELRDMRRRRVRYRGSAPARSHSSALRDLIAAQMELYTASASTTHIKIEKTDEETNTINDTHRHKDTYTRYNENNSKGNKELFKNREEYTRVKKEKYTNEDGRYPDKREKERDRRYSRHDDRKRRERYNDSCSDDRNSTSRDRTRQYESERNRQYKDRKEEKRYKRGEEIEYTRYYEYEKYGGRNSKDNR